MKTVSATLDSEHSRYNPIRVRQWFADPQQQNSGMNIYRAVFADDSDEEEMPPPPTDPTDPGPPVHTD